jgi:hypothetical protein
MRVTFFLATLLLMTPAMAQYPTYNDDPYGFGRAQENILHNGGIGERQPVPQYQATPAPFGSYDVRGTNGSRTRCSPAPFGGYDCR